MRIVVIGGTSFTGGAFARYAEAKGHEVIQVNRPTHDLLGNAPEVAARLVRLGYDRVVNFAALNMVGESWAHWVDYYKTNVIGTGLLARALIEAKVSRFVQVSTPEVYGTTQVFLSEGARFNPSTPYAVSRAAADLDLLALHRENGLPVMFTRTVNVYGPGQQAYRIIPKAALCALTRRKLALHGGGTSMRSFIHVEDVAAGILAVLENGRVGEDYHMSTDRQTAIRDLVAMVCELCGRSFYEVAVDVPDRPGKDAAYLLDDSKIVTQLGWFTRVRLEDGLRETVEWVKANSASLVDQMEYRHRP